MLPVQPERMEILFIYACPHCGHRMPLLAPTQPSMVHCEDCRKPFSVAPVDERSLRFLRTMTDNGRALVDPDYL
jgi:hypothetical protein